MRKNHDFFSIFETLRPRNLSDIRIRFQILRKILRKVQIHWWRWEKITTFFCELIRNETNFDDSLILFNHQTNVLNKHTLGSKL